MDLVMCNAKLLCANIYKIATYKKGRLKAASTVHLIFPGVLARRHACGDDLTP